MDRDWLDRLPEDIADLIRRLMPSADLDEWIESPIPALGGRSVLEMHAQPAGDDRVREYLLQALGKFGG